jgi:4-hydroxythreonine-4-phosphate dehydrogenase
VRAAQCPRTAGWVIAADAQMLKQRADLVQVPLVVKTDLDKPTCASGELTVMHTPLAARVEPGQLNTVNVEGLLGALDAAISGCLAGRFHALVTGPMQKSVVNDAGISFSGHTEYLAQASGVDDVVMLLVADGLRVALATTHLPLAQVPGAISQELLARRLSILHGELQQKFGIPKPKILVAGLNPHAGENGHLGREELDVIAPVCAQLNEQGFDLIGPLPADTLFTPQHLCDADAVMAMYHDQGLPVLKYAGFGRAVNVTLGLPFVRTSVDHGTALDKAGTPDVDSGSFAAALALATELVSVV